MKQMKFLSIMLLAIILLLFSAACSPSAEIPMPSDSDEAIEETSGADETLFTVEDVAAFDGKDGQKAYVIYDGYVYDVTDHPQWQSGSHGGNMAGTDISDNLKNVAPHGISRLGDVEKIGKIAE